MNILSRPCMTTDAFLVTQSLQVAKMSSTVKRRKTDSEVPSTLLRKKDKKERKEKQVSDKASKPAPEVEEAVNDQAAIEVSHEVSTAADEVEEEAPKSFKDLVRSQPTML